MQWLGNRSGSWRNLCHLVVIVSVACGSEQTTNDIAPGEVQELADFSGSDETARPRLLAVGTDDVFWVDGAGSLRRLAKTGGSSAVLTVDARIPVDLAVSQASVFWVVDGAAVGEPGAILHVPLDGRSATEVVQAEVRAVAADDQRLYWTEGNESLEAAAGRVMTADHAGGSATVLDEGTGDPGDLTIDAAAVYWASGAFELGDRRDTIYRVAKDADDRGLVAPPEGRVTFGSLAAFSGEVWFHDWNGNIQRVPSSGGSTATAAQGRWFAIQSKGLCVLEANATYRLVHISADGARKVLVDSDEPIELMAADETSVYWVEWQSECVKEEMSGKHYTCVEYRHEGRLARVGL